MYHETENQSSYLKIIVLGIEDKTNAVYGIGEANPFKLSDDISNMISDACTPQIEADIVAQTLEGKTVLVVAVGCTGGRHRSVAVMHALAGYVTSLGYQVTENHRDMMRT